ncbi:MAG: hypothetical protein E6I75_27730 [Chloroflexi bacterium]|nr:MAG: hypothetical protein E6I75_27730 [Chloroflexota bacterium]
MDEVDARGALRDQRLVDLHQLAVVRRGGGVAHLRRIVAGERRGLLLIGLLDHRLDGGNLGVCLGLRDGARCCSPQLVCRCGGWEGQADCDEDDHQDGRRDNHPAWSRPTVVIK